MITKANINGNTLTLEIKGTPKTLDLENGWEETWKQFEHRGNIYDVLVINQNGTTSVEVYPTYTYEGYRETDTQNCLAKTTV